MSQALPEPPPGSPSAGNNVVLTPLPSDAGELACAREYAAPLIGLDAEPDADRIDALLAVASDRIEEYAPAAPQSTRNEASVRFAGYLAQSDYGGIVDESVEGYRSVTYTVNHAAAFRNSGAMALLTRWKVRRAGAIG